MERVFRHCPEPCEGFFGRQGDLRMTERIIFNLMGKGGKDATNG